MSTDDSQMFTNFLSGSGANMLFLVGFLIYRGVSHHCQNSHSKSKCHTCCLEVEWEENSSDSADLERGKLNRNRNGTETQSRMQKMYRRNHKNVRSKPKTALQISERERLTFERRMARKRRRAQEIRRSETFQTKESERVRAYSF